MRMFIGWVLGIGAIASSVLAAARFSPRSDAHSDDKPGRTAGADARAVSYLKEVRPILSQHCFQCHGPDEAARKGKLRLDLKEQRLRRARRTARDRAW